MTFNDLDELKRYLKKDMEQVSLNPVRFISVDSMEMWIIVKNFLLSISDESLCLSEFCEENDTTPNINRVSSALKKKTKSQLVTPLSEYLRVKPEEAQSTVLKFIKADYQNNDSGKLRIYFLMYRMKSLLMSLQTDDPRQKNCIIFLETDEESDYRLTIIQKELDVSLFGNEITGFKSYLEYWESNPDKPLILHTENAIHFEKNYFFDDVYVIVSSYDLIKYQYGLPFDVTESLGSHEDWNNLVKFIVENGGFNEACCSILSINKYSLSLFEKWNRYTGFQKWILWLWTRAQPNECYTIKCAKNCAFVDQFLDEIYCRIISEIHNNMFESEYKERKDILWLIQSAPTERFWKEVTALPLQDSLLCLTCLTDIERKAIFKIIANFKYDERYTILKKLKIVYPQLYYYIYNDEQPNSANLISAHVEYFKEYKWLKATDTITNQFMEKVKMIASEKGNEVFKLQPRNILASNNYDENTIIIFIDGLGAEYIDYLVYVFSGLDSKVYSCTFEVGYCTLPSSTEFNKDFIEKRNTIQPIRELDEFKHSNNIYPESLIRQLNILDEIKDKALGCFDGNINKIIITSDHGTSRLAVKVRDTEFDNAISKPENVKIYKYGRYCDDKNGELNYPTAINYNDYLIFADYTRFVQNGTPFDETHGGASLEEWLVPVITIEKNMDGKQIKSIIIKPIITKYRPNLDTKQITVRFTISGAKREHVFAIINGNRISCTFKAGEYNFVYTPRKNDTNLIVKVIDGNILGQFDIEIEQGIKQNSKFDI